MQARDSEVLSLEIHHPDAGQSSHGSRTKRSRVAGGHHTIPGEGGHQLHSGKLRRIRAAASVLIGNTSLQHNKPHNLDNTR